VPLPLIPVAIVLIGASGAGAGSGAVGVSRVRRAKRLNDDAIQRYEQERDEHVARQARTSALLAELGTAKAQAMAGPMTRFVEAFRQLKHVQFDAVTADEPLAAGDVALAELRDLDLSVWSFGRVLGGGAAGYGAGAAAGSAASAAVMTFGTAGTGTAIGSLSGAAATNATLAWLGGGSLATGGMGVAGGTAVLSGIAAAPVLLGGGLVLWHKGDKALKDAESNCAEVEEAIAKFRAIAQRLGHVQDITVRTHAVLTRLAAKLAECAAQLELIVACEIDYRRLSDPEQQAVMEAAALAQAVRAIVDLQLVSDKGVVRRAARRRLRDLEDERA
jgi:hypothetical protein